MFKVGDNVRIIKFPNKDIVGLAGEVTKLIGHSGFSYEVKLLSNQDWTCLMHSYELEPLVKGGEQLLLFEL